MVPSSHPTQSPHTPLHRDLFSVAQKCGFSHRITSNAVKGGVGGSAEDWWSRGVSQSGAAKRVRTPSARARTGVGGLGDAEPLSEGASDGAEATEQQRAGLGAAQLRARATADGHAQHGVPPLAQLPVTQHGLAGGAEEGVAGVVSDEVRGAVDLDDEALAAALQQDVRPPRAIADGGLQRSPAASGRREQQRQAVVNSSVSKLLCLNPDGRRSRACASALQIPKDGSGPAKPHILCQEVGFQHPHNGACVSPQARPWGQLRAPTAAHSHGETSRRTLRITQARAGAGAGRPDGVGSRQTAGEGEGEGA